MSPDRHQRMADLFERACTLPPGLRPALLDALCGDDPALRADVEALLAHDERPIELIDSAARGAVASQLARDLAAAGELPAADPSGGSRPPSPPAPIDLPPRIGAYRIVRLIGEGGMGVVYEAEQDHPHRRVALKVIRPGLVTRSLLSRFRHEAQVLGHLKHPGIAQIYEAGTTDRGEGGQPYFAMELVEGPSLIDYANAKRLGARARLELMAMVCDAVHHAHQKGVVHRDLKPANILVEEATERRSAEATKGNSLGQPKILDFGVARATDADIQAVTLQTDVGQIIGTLPYMSPEQAAGDPADLDVRSDVYGLGVITYELLTGRLPYAVQGKMLHEALRVIREDPPSRLTSSRTRRRHAVGSATADDSFPIDKSLRGDVETIVAKALEKSKERRYQSAAEFAADIRRYLLDESIVARPASALYQWRRFARRNKRLVAAIGAAFAVLLIATVVSLRLLALAHVAREDARLEAEIAQITAAASLIDGGDPVAARATLESIPADRRNWEWRYHAARLDRSILRIDVGEPLSSAQFSPDGTEIITATRSGTISRWAIDGDGPRSSLKLDSETLGPIAFDRDGHLAAAATGTGHNLVVWSAADGHRVAEYELPILEGYPNLHWTRIALAPPFLPPPRNPIGSPPGTVPISVFGNGDSPFSPPPDLSPIAFISGNRHAFLLAGGIASPAPIPLETLDQALALAISRDGRRVVVSWHDGLRFFDGATGERLLVVRRPNIGALDPIAFIGDTYQVIYGARKRLFLFDPAHPDLHPSLRGHSGTITAIASDPSGRWLASGATDTTLRIWDRTTQSLVATLSGHDAAISAIKFHPDGNRILSASLDGTVRIWTRGPDDHVTVLRGHRSYVYPVAFTADGRRVVSGSWDGDLRIWDAASSECIAQIPTGDAWIASLAISPDDSCIVTGHPQGTIQFHDAATGMRIGEQRLPTRDVVNSLAFDPETSSLLLRSVAWLRIIRPPADVSRTERTADWITRAQVEPLTDPAGWTEEQKSAVACSPTGPQIAVAWQDGSVRILDLRTGAELHRVTPPTPKTLCFSLAFTPDGTQLATGSRDGTIHLWNTATGKLIRTMTGHQSDVYALAFSPDGTRLASGSDDTSIRLWDPTTGKQFALLPGHDDYVFSLAFSPDGSTLVSGSGDTTLRVWDTRPVHERWRAAKQMQSARATAQPQVEALLADLTDPTDVAARLRAGASLTAPQREAALQLVLKMQTAAARAAGPQ